MKDYELTDQATFYFVVQTDRKSGAEIVKGYTDDKGLAKFYIDFHSCPTLSLRTVTRPMQHIVKLLNANANDEIQMYNIVTRNRSDRDELTKIISVPATEPEMVHVRDMANTMCSAMVDYGFINNYFPRLKERYQEALEGIWLLNVIKQEIHGQPSKFTSGVIMDELMVLIKFFPDLFG